MHCLLLILYLEIIRKYLFDYQLYNRPENNDRSENNMKYFNIFSNIKASFKIII